jgi:hypothetical protein
MTMVLHFGAMQFLDSNSLSNIQDKTGCLQIVECRIKWMKTLLDGVAVVEEVETGSYLYLQQLVFYNLLINMILSCFTEMADGQGQMDPNKINTTQFVVVVVMDEVGVAGVPKRRLSAPGANLNNNKCSNSSNNNNKETLGANQRHPQITQADGVKTALLSTQATGVLHQRTRCVLFSFLI